VTAPRISVLPGDGLRFGRYAPDPGLADHVDSYWTLDVDRPPATVSVVADGLVDLTFTLGDDPGAWVTGPLESSASYRHERPVSLLGASLRPGAALPVLGVSVGSLPAEWSPLSTVVGPVAGELAARIAALPTVPERLALLDVFLAARLAETTHDGRLRAALGALDGSGGGLGVEGLARTVATSPRHLRRLFQDWVGMSPKRFARIARVQAALRRLSAEPDTELAGLAAELGFADQAHLTREVRALAGTTPGRLLAASFNPEGYPGS
jgi:AraC-like DNA-binding protein